MCARAESGRRLRKPRYWTAFWLLQGFWYVVALVYGAGDELAILITLAAAKMLGIPVSAVLAISYIRITRLLAAILLPCAIALIGLRIANALPELLAFLTYFVLFLCSAAILGACLSWDTVRRRDGRERE